MKYWPKELDERKVLIVILAIILGWAVWNVAHAGPDGAYGGTNYSDSKAKAASQAKADTRANAAINTIIGLSQSGGVPYTSGPEKEKTTGLHVGGT